MTKFYRNRFTLGDIPQLDAVAFVMPIPTSGLNLWLKADAISGLTNGQTISSWNDSSGNERHATQANSSYQPTYQTNVLNGFPVIRFDGSNDWLEVVNSVFNGLSNATTVFLVQKTTNITSQKTNFSAYPDDASNRFSTHTPWSDGTVYWDFGNINSGYPGRLEGAWGGNGTTFYYWTYLVGSGMAVRRSGTQILSKVNNSTFTAGTKTLKIGAVGTYAFAGDMAEFIIYNRRLSAEEITQVETYLKNKYNL